MIAETISGAVVIWNMGRMPGDLNELIVTAPDYPALFDSVSLSGVTPFTNPGDWWYGNVHRRTGELWRESGPEAGDSVWRVLPWPYQVRFFWGVEVSEGSTIFVEPQPVSFSNVEVRYTNTKGVGRVAADPTAIGGTTVGASITMQADSHGVAEAYWAPGYDLAGGATLFVEVLIDGNTYGDDFDYDSDVNLVGDTMLSASVVGRDGLERELSAGGFALSSDREVVLSANNPLRADYWLEVTSEPLGDDGEVFDWGGLDWHEGAGGYRYLLASAGVDNLFTLPLREGSDGGSLKYRAVYSPTLVSKNEDGSEPPPEGSTCTPHGEDEATVGSFKLRSIDFIPSDGGDEIELYSAFLGQNVHNPEWVNAVGDQPPSQEHYDSNTSAPAAYKIDDFLTAKVLYECYAFSTASISATCDPHPEDLSGKVYCPFGGILQTAITCTDGHGRATLNSITASTSVSASTNQFNWEIYSTDLGQTVGVQESEHRIYTTLLDEPPVNFEQRYNLAWIELIELSTIMAEDETTCSGIYSALTNGVYNRDWLSYDSSFNFIDPTNDFTYVGGKHPYFEEIFGTIDQDFISVYESDLIQPWDLALLLVDIEKPPIPAQTFIGNCYTISNYLAVLVRSLGCDISNYAIVIFVDPEQQKNLNFSTNDYHLINHGLKENDAFGAHSIAGIEQGNTIYVYDPMIRLIDGNSVLKVNGMDQARYVELLKKSPTNEPTFEKRGVYVPE